ncbi:MAG: type II secretion system inner membrane protein GspF [Bdellovibrionales bacterium]|nr:type II secretion system inner membrane protein GspF [Bdellovibrionales bacterium]
MPIYEYKGLTKAGKNVKGTVDAENVRTARSKLKRDGIFVVDLADKTKRQKKKKKTTSGNKSVGIDDMSNMTRQLASLIRANVPLVDALGACSDQMENPTLKEVLADCKNAVNEGSQFHKSLRKYPKIFDKIYVSMVEAGEMSGTLDVILLRLAEFKEDSAELNAKIKSAMLYPIIMVIFMMLILSVMFVFVVPQMTSIFADAEMALPWYTQMVIDISGVFVNYWWAILIGAVGLFWTFRQWKSSPGGRPKWDAMKLVFPVSGKLTRMIAVSRFTRTLSTLLTGGVPMLNAMDIVKNVVNNEVLAKSIREARDNISEGESIAGPLKKSGEFPPIVIHMVSIGEKTGELEKMLNQVADTYDFQVKNQVSGLTSVLEPVMIIVMGCVIGVIVFSLMVPMFELANLAG